MSEEIQNQQENEDTEGQGLTGYRRTEDENADTEGHGLTGYR